MLDRLLINRTTPGYFFVGIFLFAALGLLLTAILLFWVYADSSPRNYRVEYKGNIEFNQNVTDNFRFRKETHHYRFQGISGQVIDVRLTTGTQIRYGIKFYLTETKKLSTLDSPTHVMYLTGGDTEGIVHKMTDVFTSMGINIIEITTDTKNAIFTVLIKTV